MDARNQTFETTFGELVAALWEAFYEEYGDDDLATIATAALLQERALDYEPPGLFEADSYAA